ncbi:MAG: hypothetical protein HY802_05510 [Methanobacterium sp.]|nr:hypothetical protein [Methanobacterium sp.]
MLFNFSSHPKRQNDAFKSTSYKEKAFNIHPTGATHTWIPGATLTFITSVETRKEEFQTITRDIKGPVTIARRYALQHKLSKFINYYKGI